MKNKKVLIIVGVIILVISILIYIFISTSTNDKNDVVKSNFTIPSDYLKKFENHMSHVDGPDIDYYIYNDKIIIDKNNICNLGFMNKLIF